MDTLLKYGIELILALQGLGDWLIGPMKAFSFLGNEEFFLILMPTLYWCISPIMGLRIGLYLMISNGLNAAFKIGLHGPRPYWIDAADKDLPLMLAHAAETSFGIPSGHAQHAVVVWGGIAAWVKRGWVWAVALSLIFIIGLSRLFLAVHFPTDVLAGWLIGALLLWILVKLEAPLSARLRQISVRKQLVGIALISSGIILLGLAARASLGDWVIPPSWIDNAAIAFPEADPLNPLNFSTIAASAGVFLGLAMGVVWLNQRGGFEVRASLGQYLARYLIGLAGTLLIWMGLKLILPDSDDLPGNSLRYMRYALLGFWISALAPWTFIRLRLSRPLTTVTVPAKSTGS